MSAQEAGRDSQTPTQSVKDSSSSFLLLLVQPVEPSHCQIDNADSDESIHERLGRFDLLLLCTLLSILIIVFIIESLGIQPLLEQLNDGDEDIGVLVRKQVAEGFGGGQVEEDRIGQSWCR